MNKSFKNNSIPENSFHDKFDELETYIDSLDTTKGALVQILHKAQSIFGFLPKDVQLFISRKLNIPGSEVYGVVSFYSYFNTKPVGLHVISVCLGTACFVKGANKILKKLKDLLDLEPGETTEDGLFTLKDVRCIGACGLAPILVIDEKVYGGVSEEEIEDIINNYKKENKANVY